MRYIIYTLGCKVNQYETQAMETLLREHGHKACREGESADAVIVNTCAVTAEAGRKSRQAINRLREENPNAVVAVSGCYSQLSPDTAQELGADIVYGTADRVKSRRSRKPSLRARAREALTSPLSAACLRSCPPEPSPAIPGPCSKFRTAASISALTASFHIPAAG